MSVKELFERVYNEKRRELTELEAKNVLDEYDVPVIQTELARSPSEAVKLANELQYPVVLKIASPDILHKVDAGGVKTFLRTDEEVTSAFSEILDNAKRYNPDARILGLTVQHHIPRGVEVIIGGLRDPVFGPCVMFGMGGTWVEVMNDVSFRLAPTKQKSALAMIQEIKAYPLLNQYRGSEGVDIKGIADIIVKVSKLIYENEIIAEIDVNPVFARIESSIAVDARIVLKHIP
jgi:acyl-CoA synthetase (NDP forming)